MKGMEAIYLQRLEPSVKIGKRKKQKDTRARFRECHDRVYNEADKYAEDLAVKDELESTISYNIASHMGRLAGPTTAKAEEIKTIK